MAFGTGREIMYNLNYNNKKKKNSKATTVTFLLLGTTILVVTGVSTSLATLSQSASAQRFIDQESDFAVEPKGPMAVS